MSSDDTEELLSFKEFPMIHTTGNQRSGNVAQLEVTSSPKKSRNVVQDLLQITTEPNPPENNPDNENETKTTNNHSFFTIEYYQQFFDVDTYMVLDRIASSMIPKRAASNYLRTTIGANPDLYGPIWIVITLIFSIAISGNLANYLQQPGDSVQTKWRYNFHLVSYAATAILLYSCFLPSVLWGFFKWSLKPVDPNFETDVSSYTPSLLSLLCIYGYSLAIYIPVSVLWMIPVSFLQWLLVVTAAALSGSVLLHVMMPAAKNSRYSLIIMLAVVAAHFLLAVSFMLYFFHNPKAVDVPPPIIAKPTVGAIVEKIAGKSN